jgi:hypothetical protein
MSMTAVWDKKLNTTNIAGHNPKVLINGKIDFEFQINQAQQ